ncbi:helix-turn-helix domain-containing protein [Streptomyces sp. NRRL F-2664]|uniref:helix-turn-helix domain-containing protein n=1 Tax=Streptomyces sp. NRRL F-2664 TaxID=1463842 RepID=UPI00068EDE75|nr:helix-turn-helix domain-containing protein [Streptomyces sp. NRRL F-2664]
MAEDVGALLRRLRERAGLTQEQVAERSGVSVRTIRRLENDRSTNHRVATLNLLADALGLEEGDRRLVAAALAGSPATTGTAGAGGGAGRPAGADHPAGRGLPAQAATAAVPGGADGPVRGTVYDAAQDPARAPVRDPVDATVHGPAPVRAAVHGRLADAAEELAVEVRRRWRREEAQRRVHDPFPLPVRWTPAPAALTDRAENIQRLGPGERPRTVDLEGDLRSLAEVYLRIPSGRLVVLGRAGSGKSVLTIRLVLDLLQARGASAEERRVPVVFSVGSWDPSATALRDWLVGRLLRDHPHLARRGPGGATLAAALVDGDFVLPVLDGFDEMAEGLRREALDALNATAAPLVLTSRHDEYAEAVRAAHAPLVWAGCIELSDLTLEDLADYLPRTARAVAPARTGGAAVSGSTWDAVLAELRTRPESAAHRNLAAVLTTPLMVVLARTLYSESSDRDPAELLDGERFPSQKSLSEHLLAGFVPAVYRRRTPERDAGGPRPGAPYADAARAERWLGHLAHHLVRADRERHDLAWWQLGHALSRTARTVALVLATALAVAVADWSVGLLLAPLPPGEILLQGALMGPAAGLGFGAVHAMADRSGGAAFEPTRVRLTLRTARAGLPRRSLRTFLSRVGQGLIGGTVMGIGCAVALTLQRALAAGTPLADPDVVSGTLINMLVFVLIFGPAAGLVFALMAALEAPVDVSTAATPVSLLASNRATAGRQFLILAVALCLAVAFGGYLVVAALRTVMGPLNWGIGDSLFIGTVGGLGGAAAYVLAFTAWGQWIVLARVCLPLAGRLPADPAGFLDDAYRRGVLRQTGAVYQFRHERLQHHLGRAHRGAHRDFAPAAFEPASPDGRLGADRADGRCGAVEGKGD